jgi:hypothetical protein
MGGILIESSEKPLEKRGVQPVIRNAAKARSFDRNSFTLAEPDAVRGHREPRQLADGRDRLLGSPEGRQQQKGRPN